MYRVTAFLQKTPILLAAAIMGWVNFMIGEGWISLSDKGVTNLNTALMATLLIFVSSQTENKAKLDELEKAMPPVVAKKGTRRAS